MGASQSAQTLPLFSIDGIDKRPRTFRECWIEANRHHQRDRSINLESLVHGLHMESINFSKLQHIVAAQRKSPSTSLGLPEDSESKEYQALLEISHTHFQIFASALPAIARVQGNAAAEGVDATSSLESVGKFIDRMNELTGLQTQFANLLKIAREEGLICCGDSETPQSASVGQLLRDLHTLGTICFALRAEKEVLTDKLDKSSANEVSLNMEYAEHLKSMTERELEHGEQSLVFKKDCHEKDIRIKALEGENSDLLRAENKELQEAKENLVYLDRYGEQVIKLGEEIIKLRQSESKLQKDLEDATNSGFELATLLRQRVDSTKRATELGKELEHIKAENKQLKKERNKISDNGNKVKAFTNQLGVENLVEAKTEITRLTNQAERVESLREENADLKSKYANIKDSEAHLRRANVDLEERVRQANLKLEKAGYDNTDASADASDDEGLTNAVAGLSFPDGAAKVLQNLKTILRGLRNHISGMQDVGGNGWSIVERTEAAVKEEIKRMLKKIDDCLALQSAAQREKERVEGLETGGFPVLQAIAVSEASQNSNDGPWMTKKKSKKNLKNKKSMVKLN